MRPSRLFKPKQLRMSLVVALIVAIPLSVFGFAAGMGLAHSGGLVLLLFLPTWPVFALFGGGGPFEGIPEWLFVGLAALAEVVGVFVLVHLSRVFLVRGESDA